METNDLKLDTHELRMEALQNAMQMVNELEMKANVKGKIADLLEEENENLMNTVNSLQEKIDGLEVEKEDCMKMIDELFLEKEELLGEIQDTRKTYTAFHVAISLLVFGYGLFYGVYFGKCV